MIDQPPANWKRGLLNCFIAIHVVILFLWGLPSNIFAVKTTAPFARYVLFTGLWHRWSMFAPSPYTLNYDMRAQIEFQDGSSKQWIWPRMEEFSLWKRIPKERFRKWRELMFNDSFAGSWRHNAKFIARQVNSNPANPPVKVTLTRFWSPIAPPIAKRDYQPRPKTVTATKSFSIGTYLIAPTDLQ
ncbi:MAG TPA: hypothetical protein VM680_11445 [Verrucomicrobiae bacterium]|nr:hypothetical protein [Verrucomicrobiae bacterium]